MPLRALAIFVLLATSAHAQQPATTTASAPAERKPVTYDVAFGRNPPDFDGEYARGMTWLPDGSAFLHRRDGELRRIDPLTDEAADPWDRDAFAAALIAQGDFNEEQAQRFAANPGTFNKDRTAVFIEHKDAIYLYRFEDHSVAKIGLEPQKALVRTYSPRCGYVGFVRDNDLYVLDAATGQERRLTTDGNDKLLNGILDWVYEEELYGRGNRKGYWWSPDDRRIAFLQLNETNVPMFTIVDPVTTRPSVETYPYPKAGDPNPTVRLGIVQTADAATVWADLSKYAGQDILISRVSWSPTGRLLFQLQDREQRWLDLNEADPATGAVTTLFRETTAAWVEAEAEPKFLDDGSFLWLSERDGYKHIYHYTADGRIIRRVTAGAWEVRSLLGIDPGAAWVYFTGTRDGAVESHAYRAPLAGGAVERLTEPGYSHDVNFDPRFAYFFDTYSNLTTPRQVALRKSDGTLVRSVSENHPRALEEYVLATPQLVRFPARDGWMLSATLLLPPDRQPQKRYPVWSSTYAGPHAPSVSNRWPGRGMLQDQYLAQQGFIVWTCDPRSASGEGAVATWQAYMRLGEAELRDLEDGVRWLIDQGYADPQRVGLTGYSYGGFMTCYALTHSDVFSLGIAGGSVTDWHFYDSIYTERYMRTPQNNPAGYAATSCVKAAANLKGKLLLVHGALDDNVHFQNALAFMVELQKANKQFELMIYPLDRHGIGRGATHFRNLRLDWILHKL